MTRKHYVAIAAIINADTIRDGTGKWNAVDKTDLINDLCAFFKRDNSKFNPATFRDACDE